MIRKYNKNIPDRIYMNATDVHVSTYICYVDENDIACYDEECLYPIGKEKLHDLYVKGLKIFIDGVLYVPMSVLVNDEEKTSISYLFYDKEEEGKAELEYKIITSGIEKDEDEDSEEEDNGDDNDDNGETLELLSLSIGDQVLTPPFVSDEFSYSLITDHESDLIIAISSIEAAIITAKYGGVSVDLSEPIDWDEGEKDLVITLLLDGIGEPVVYTVAVTYESQIFSPPRLASLSIGANDLVPLFTPETFEYTMATSETSDVLQLTTDPDDCTIVVKQDNQTITDYAEGIIWSSGVNVITIILGDETPTVEYTITVTATI